MQQVHNNNQLQLKPKSTQEKQTTKDQQSKEHFVDILYLNNELIITKAIIQSTKLYAKNPKKGISVTELFDNNTSSQILSALGNKIEKTTITISNQATSQLDLQLITAADFETIVILSPTSNTNSYQNSKNNETERASEFLKILPYGIFECDLKGNINYFNQNGRALFNYEPTDTQINLKDLVLPSELKELISFLHVSLNETHFISKEFTTQKKTSEKFYSKFYIVPMLDKQITRGYRGLIFDISKQHQIQKAYEEEKNKTLETNELKSLFLANLSHELRTPLNGILGFSELLKIEENLSKDAQESVSIINASANHLNTIINDILDLSKIDQGDIQLDKEVFDLNPFIDKIAHIYINEIKYHKKSIQLIVKKDNKSVDNKIKTDQKKLRQILNNLMSNAVKFTEIGTIELGFLKKNSKEFLFYIKDTGIGISDEIQKNIFSRYLQLDNAVTRKYNGNGIGLSISKELVSILGGKISFKSIIDKGTTFYFTIPTED